MPFRPLVRSTLMAAAAFAATAVYAAPISVGAFLARAAPLRANPLMALVSPDYAPLKAEADAAAHQLRADAAARKAAGKPPLACVPEDQSFGIMDMLAGLDTLPTADKRLPLKDGYVKVLAKRFPCR